MNEEQMRLVKSVQHLVAAAGEQDELDQVQLSLLQAVANKLPRSIEVAEEICGELEQLLIDLHAKGCDYQNSPTLRRYYHEGKLALTQYETLVATFEAAQEIITRHRRKKPT